MDMGTNTDKIRSILKHASNGSKIKIGRNHLGQVKVKVGYGLFNFLTRNYTIDASEYNCLREKLKRM